jgi:hypothetical protein
VGAEGEVLQQSRNPENLYIELQIKSASMKHC